MLSNTLNTSEIKDRSGTEVEFGRISTGVRTTEFAKLTESPALPHRLTISHTEIGSGVTKRRRSVVRFDLTVTGQVDTTTNVVASAYIVCDLPIGNLTDNYTAANVLANLLSFSATTGAATTVLFDGTGNGASALIQGTL